MHTNAGSEVDFNFIKTLFKDLELNEETLQICTFRTYITYRTSSYVFKDFKNFKTLI